MHRETTKGRGRSRSLVVLLLVVLAVALIGLLAQQALALPTFDTAAQGIGPCDKCHTSATIHPPSNPMPGTNTNHNNVACATCHVNGTAKPPLPSACASCHGAANILAATSHTAQGCASTPGCHGAAAPSITIAVAPKVIKLKKSVTVSGTIGPSTLTVKTVAMTVQRKVGTKWVQAKVGAAPVTALKYSWKYVVTKKGSYRVNGSFVATTGASKTVSKWAMFSAK
jgi:hypothetical protein